MIKKDNKMSPMQEMRCLVDKIRKSPTTDEMVDNGIQLIVEYGDVVDIIPAYHQGSIRSYNAFEPGEKRDNIFNITESWSSIYDKSGWKYKNLFLGTSAQSGAGMVSQLDAIDEKMGNRRGIHDINPGFCFYEAFNKMDMLFRLCGENVKGLSFDKRTNLHPTKTSRDNLIIEMRYPDCTPEYRADVCTRLIKDYGSCLCFVPVCNPNQMVKYAVKVHGKWDKEKQRIFAVCEKVDGGFAIIYSKENFQIADKDDNPEAIPVFGALLNLCKDKAR